MKGLKRGAMIRSMTAYGRAGRTALGKDILVEIKSVNNRYFDVSVKLPRAYGFLEEKIKAYIGSNGIARGKIDVYVSVETLPGSGTEIALNEAYAAAYLKALRKLRDTFDIKDDISVMRMAQNRDIFAVGKQEESPEEDWDAVRPALDEALAQFLQMREAEGEPISPKKRSGLPPILWKLKKDLRKIRPRTIRKCCRESGSSLRTAKPPLRRAGS